MCIKGVGVWLGAQSNSKNKRQSQGFELCSPCEQTLSQHRVRPSLDHRVNRPLLDSENPHRPGREKTGCERVNVLKLPPPPRPPSPLEAQESPACHTLCPSSLGAERGDPLFGADGEAHRTPRAPCCLCRNVIFFSRRRPAGSAKRALSGRVGKCRPQAGGGSGICAHPSLSKGKTRRAAPGSCFSLFGTESGVFTLKQGEGVSARAMTSRSPAAAAGLSPLGRQPGWVQGVVSAVGAAAEACGQSALLPPAL